VEVFHVEQKRMELNDTLRDRFAFALDILDKYAELIFFENMKYNLTGLKSVQDIWATLIVKSLVPLLDLKVPQGSKFIDIGTGSGIPGIVVAICFPQLSGVLVDANSKKTDFLKMIIEKLSLKNVVVLKGRVEDLAREKGFKKEFDWCFTRAFGPIYYSIEFGLPVLKEKGLLYIYSNLVPSELSHDIIDHISNLGGRLIENSAHSNYGFNVEGLLIEKIKKTNQIYPRRFSLIKREAVKVPEVR
jgi:16S rRNA (guanine527-N7)-methyltransferase